MSFTEKLQVWNEALEKAASIADHWADAKDDELRLRPSFPKSIGRH